MSPLGGIPLSRAPGFSWDGRHSRDFGIYLLRSRFRLLPQTRNRYLAIAGRHGDWDFGFDFEGREVELEVIIAASSEWELRERVRQVSAWLDPSKGERQLILDAEPDKFYKARFAGSAEVEFMAAAVGRAVIPFRASDPFAYALADDVFTYNGPGTYQFSRKGTAPSFPLVELQGESPGGSSRIAITLNGRTLRYSGPLAAGETLVIDSDLITAYVRKPNGSQVSALNDLDSLSFPVALPGTNQLSLAVQGAASISRVTITCRSRWY